MGVPVEQDVRLLFPRRVARPEQAALDPQSVSVAEEETKASDGDQPGQGRIGAPAVAVAADCDNRQKGKFPFQLFGIPIVVAQVEHVVWLLLLDRLAHVGQFPVGIGKDQDFHM